MDVFRRCLAVVNNKKKKELNQRLCDDVVHLIVLRLPLRYAIQCKTLDKNLYAYISDPTFNQKHAILSSTDEINRRIHVYSTIYDPCRIFTKFTPQSSIRLPHYVSVLASCNGLLLLSIGYYRHELFNPCCVFNPITGQALFIDLMRVVDIVCPGAPPGLAVDLRNNETNFNHYPFKLVMPRKTDDGLRFEVIVPSGNSTTLKSIVDFVCRRFTWLIDQKTQPVYLNRALYWLERDLSKTLVFDVENEKAKLINGPLGLTRGQCKPNVWFGLAQGWLSFIYTSNEETCTILSHDNTNDKWQIRHRIAIVSNSGNLFTFRPLCFDGENLLFQVAGKREVYVYKMSTKRWEKKGVVKGGFLLLCIPYLPTFAKVYDSDIDQNHLHNKNKGMCYESLLQLQHFFRHH